eukprot:m.164984 g.164984  ORF g.164984 m.164984 type:complete len:269 (-) comp12498_c0_seq1:872-1678(-)
MGCSLSSRSHADPTIYATGTWRDNPDAVAQLTKLLRGPKVQILSQQLEARFEAESVLKMLMFNGLSHEDADLLLIGTGRGSCQATVCLKGRLVGATTFASGYPKGKKPLMEDKRMMVDELVKDFPIKAVVVWGAAYYISLECMAPVWKDKSELDLRGGFDALPWQPGSVFSGLEWITSLERLPMLLIRNIKMKDGTIWKANWGEMLQADSYIDVGSGKIAEISTRTGEQFRNVTIEGISNIPQAAEVIMKFPTFKGEEPMRLPDEENP